MARKTSTERYAAAKKLLRRNENVMLKYYNTYARSRSLKVFFWDGHQSRELFAQLEKLADRTTFVDRGGIIFSFAREVK